MAPLDASLSGALNRLRLPDLWQREAVQALREGADVVVDAPTGAGKTYVFELFADEAAAPNRQMVFAVPTRALANDKYQEWKAAGRQVGITTGDLSIDADAPLVVATLEAQRERLLSPAAPSLLAIDEYQMLADASRGSHYEAVIAAAPPSVQLLLLSGSVANPGDIAAWLERIGRRAALVRSAERPVPLDEMHAAGMPRQAPRQVTGFFERTAYAACLSGLAPLLIFAPRRSTAETLARRIAAALPDDLPLHLPTEVESKCPAALRSLLAKRVAWHHSGLPYAVRAGIVEPLAKNGQLRVVVATMGLAAGINFSVRSVLVSGKSYREGPFEKEVRPDELLQMFGRAGRRGLDDAGWVLTADRLPQLADARPRRLRGSGLLDAPAFLQRMLVASRQGSSPLDAAENFAARHFPSTPPSLGIGESADDPEDKPNDTQAPTQPEDPDPYAAGPRRCEMMNAAGDWEAQPEAPVERPATRCLSRRRGEWVPSLRNADLVRALLPPGRLCRLAPSSAPERWRYGMEIVAATRREPQQGWTPTRMVAAALGIRREPIEPTLWHDKIRRRFLRTLKGCALWQEIESSTQLRLRIDPANVPLVAWIDQSGQALIDPPLRHVEGGHPTYLERFPGEQKINPQRSSPLWVWRRLGLIEADGAPTPRGLVAARFQRGEGLAIAAALEDRSYPVEEILWALANLRGSHHFADFGGEDSGRLAASCRAAFGSLSFPGVLEHGLPVSYAEGTGDILHTLFLERRLPPGINPPAGDIERARVEWISLLRHLAACPEFDWPRWNELRFLAADFLERHPPPSPLPPAELSRPLRHLRVPDLAIRRRSG